MKKKMPFYKLICKKCGWEYEELFSSFDVFKKEINRGIECPQCNELMKMGITAPQNNAYQLKKKVHGYLQ